MARRRRSTRRNTRRTNPRVPSRPNGLRFSRHNVPKTRDFGNWRRNVELQRRHALKANRRRSLTSDLSRLARSVNRKIRFRWTKVGTSFASVRPTRLRVCARRAIRKSVLHAIGKAGKGGQKPAKWKNESYIKC